MKLRKATSRWRVWASRLPTCQRNAPNGNLGLASSASTHADNVLQLDNDGAKESGEDDIVHLVPKRDHRVNNVVEGVVM
jgi:hypothetical protein